jgi:glycosyltransferase involved in cell wall biosynthesis
MSKLPISCYIIACNEADRIALTLASVRDLVDELIVIDSGSTDDTVAICESFGARVVHNPWPGFGYQKRFGEDQCNHDWLLNLDADEELTPAIIQEIRGLFAQGLPSASAYMLRIRDLLPGEKKLAPFAHTDFRIRLYDKRKGRNEAQSYFDLVIIEQGEVITLKHPVLHRSFRSLSHMIAKNNTNTDQLVPRMLERGLSYPYFRIAIEIPVAFFKAYILRGYIVRGWRGFIYANIYAYGRFVRIAKYIEALEKK